MEEDTGMAERAVAAVAGDDALIHVEDFGGRRRSTCVRHDGDFSGDERVGDDSDATCACNHASLMRRRHFITLPLILPMIGGCAEHLVPEGPTATPPDTASGAFVMPDGMRLPYRLWKPEGPPRAIVLALHGMNDSRDAFEIPAPAFTAAGIEVIAPDQRGFGATADRAYWPGTKTLVADARIMAELVHERHPQTPLFVMGESMGAAVLICLATAPDPPPVNGYVLVSPAVWGRSEMNPFERVGLWLMATTLPGLTATGGFLHVKASNNRAALERLSTDPLTIHDTRFDAVRGLVNLMSEALEDMRTLSVRALLLYGGQDQLIPQRAMRAGWRSLPPGPQIAYYPDDYHLMLRDHERAVPIKDIIFWMSHPGAPLPSEADSAAQRWLGSRGGKAVAFARSGLGL
jgi:acylglycerol lipase